MAVLGPSPLQLVHPLQQHGDLLALLLDDGLEFGDLFGWRHAPIVRLLGKSD